MVGSIAVGVAKTKWTRKLVLGSSRQSVCLSSKYFAPMSVQLLHSESTGHEGESVQERAEYVRQALIKARLGSDDPAKMALEVFQTAGPPYFGLMESAWTLELVTRHAAKSSKHMNRFGALLLHLDTLLGQVLHAPLRYWPTLARTPAEKAYYYDTVEPMTQEAIEGFISCMQLLTKALSRLDQVTVLNARLFRKVDTILQRLLQPKTKSHEAREKWNALLRKPSSFRILVTTMETLTSIGIFSDQLLLAYGNIFRSSEGFSDAAFREIGLGDLSRYCRSLCIARFWPEGHEVHREPGPLDDDSLSEFWMSAIRVLLQKLQANPDQSSEQSGDIDEGNGNDGTANETVLTKVWTTKMDTPLWDDDDTSDDTSMEEHQKSEGQIYGTWEEYYNEARNLSKSSIDEELEERHNAIRDFARNGFIANTKLITQDDSLDISQSETSDESQVSLKAVLARIHIIRLSLKYASDLQPEVWYPLNEKRLRDSSTYLYKIMSPRKVTTYQKRVLEKMLQRNYFKPAYFEEDTVPGLKCALVWPLEKVGVDIDAVHRSFRPISPGADIEWVSSRSDAGKEQERQSWLQQQAHGSLEGFDPIALLGTGRAKLSQLPASHSTPKSGHGQTQLLTSGNSASRDVQTREDSISIQGSKSDQIITHLLPPSLKKNIENRGLEAAEVSYYRARSAVPLPPTKLKQEILENAGWSFVLLPFESWQSISSSRRAQYFQMLVPPSVKQPNKV